MKEYMEFSAKTVDEAITKALLELETSSDRIEYEVIEKGASGFLGMFSRPAVIRVARLSDEDDDFLMEEPKKEEKIPEQKEEQAVSPKKENRESQSENPERIQSEQNKNNKIQSNILPQTGDKVEKISPSVDKQESVAGRDSSGRTYNNNRNNRDRDNRDRKDRRPDSRDGRETRSGVDSNNGNNSKSNSKQGGSGKPRRDRNVNSTNVVNEPVPEPEKEKILIKEPEDENVVALMKKVEEFLLSVITSMGMNAEMETLYDEEDKTICVNISGENMGVLIGKRGQTLDSLQYLGSLVVNKGQDEYIRVKLDTENYRERRKETLENLARNIAYKVKRTKKPVSLEPMNPYERRIIHATLQNDKYVVTRSEGVEPYRYVVISPKNGRYNNNNKK